LGLLGTARLLLGETAEAEVALAEAVEAGGDAGALVAWGLRASLAMARRDWTAGERCAHESRAVLARAHIENIAPALMAHAVAARVAIHHGAVALARDELVRAQLLRPIATYALPWFTVCASLELARAYMALADIPGARNVLAEAEAVIRRRPALGTLVAGVAEMRDRVRDASSSLAGSAALTAAELRLLPMLSTPLTFKEISGRVFLSPHTVKTHAVSIYGKLQVSSRSEAVQRAIELGLLEPFPAPLFARERSRE
jgi:LuxR family maltose regulon positive regulatory protein